MGCCPISTTISSRSHCAYVPATGCRQRWNRTSEGQLWVEPPRRWGSRKVRIRRVLPVGVYQGEGPLTEPTGAAHPDRRLPLFRPRSCRALDPDFVIMARCDLGGVPGASFAEIIERCQAYKAEAQVDVICPNGLRTWEEIQEAIRLIPGPVVPLIPADLSPYPSLQAQQDAGAAAAWFPALTTMAGLQANWDFLSDFRQRGTLALDALRAQAAQSPWGVASNGRILDEPRLRSMEEMYLPN